MITSSGKQSDNQMCMFVIQVLQKSKYHYLALPWHTPGQPQGPSICKFFSSSIAERAGPERGYSPPLLGTKHKKNIEFKKKMANICFFMTQPSLPTFEHALRALFLQVYKRHCKRQRKILCIK